MRRRQFLTNGAAATLAATTPSFLGLSLSTWGSSDTLTEAALTADLETFGGDGNPSFMFHYAGVEEREKLVDWADSNGEVKRDLESVKMMAISASWEDIGLDERGYGAATVDHISGGVQANDYVDYIDANTKHELPEPIDELEGEDVWSLDSFDLDWKQSLSVMARTFSRNPLPDSSGLAFDEDAPEATLSESREHVRATDSVIANQDTSGLIIAVGDTGVNTGTNLPESRLHTESTNFASDGTDETVADNGSEAVADGADSRHGTWVAHCMAGANGFAPDASVLGLKVLGDDGSGETADIVAGVEKAIAVGADVLCLSLGSPMWSQALADALTEARDAGILCAVAVGNDRYGTVFMASPSDSNDGFGVQACNVPTERDETKPAYFGNIGPDPKTSNYPLIAAPGMNITIELPSGPKNLSGTSMAAPHLGGGAALLRAAGYSATESWDRILEHAYPIQHAGETEAKHGLLDVEAAITGTVPENDPADVRTSEAEARDDFNDLLSGVMG